MGPAAVLHVKVVPGASRTRFAGRYGEGIKVQVAAAPEHGKANAAAVRLLAELLAVGPGRVHLVAGQSRPRKTFRIDGLDAAALNEKLGKLSGN